MSVSAHILVTAGPTCEPIDAVRYITNCSSGKMGYSIAEEALSRGYGVTLISGPTNLTHHPDIRLIKVKTAEEMHTVVMDLSSQCDVIIMTAAVADYTPVNPVNFKIKKNSDELCIKLKRTKDILYELGKIKRRGQTLVGFAAETDNLKNYALDKLKKKNLDWIVGNIVSSKETGFGSDCNAAIMYSASGRVVEIPKMSKKAMSGIILDNLLI